MTLVAYDEAIRQALRPPPPPPVELIPLGGHPNRDVICDCAHTGKDHSHILVDEPCLECDCWGFHFHHHATRPELDAEWKAREDAYIISRAQAVGMGIIAPRRLL